MQKHVDTVAHQGGLTLLTKGFLKQDGKSLASF